MFDSPAVYYLGAALVGLALFIAFFAFLPKQDD